MTRLVHGVGINEAGKFKSATRIYFLWTNMLQRCYSKEYQVKRPSYVGCTVSKRWRSFQNFAADVSTMTGFDQQGWHLDKDILRKGNKRYSRCTCCFVPRQINSLFVNAKAIRGEFPVGVTFNPRQINRPYNVQCYRRGIKNPHIGAYATVEEAFSVYARVKQKEIRRVAKNHKAELDPKVYRVLRHYRVEIGD